LFCRRKSQTFSIEFNSGEYGGKDSRRMLSGTTNSFPRWCQPAPSQITTAIELGVTWVLSSFRCSVIPSALAAGMITAAPTPLAGQMAPKM